MAVHGDVFTALGTSAQLTWYEEELANAFEIKIKGRLGESPSCDKEVRVLNRIIRIDTDGIHIEADPRHSELLVKQKYGI